MIFPSRPEQLAAIARCHQKAFSSSFSSSLGTRYVAKMLEWYLVADNRVLFHIEEEGKVVGYCGGYQRLTEPYGSSSGMTQHAFREGIRAMLLRPWLLMHPKILPNYKFLMRNLWYRFFPPKSKVKERTDQNILSTQDGSTGLVVIGVDPACQGKGYGSLLIKEFERLAKSMGSQKVTLVVESDNHPAIRAYERNGWVKGKLEGKSLSMYKNVDKG